MHEQNENINKETETNSGLMNIVGELKISLEKINKLDQAEERINKLKDMPFEMIRSEE